MTQTDDDAKNELSFREAMLLDRHDVEVHVAVNGYWRSLVDAEGAHLAKDIRTAKFRRASPKRSRVQEMAEATALTGDAAVIYTAFGERCIRAVCEFVREHSAKTGALPDALGIERHFLEPR